MNPGEVANLVIVLVISKEAVIIVIFGQCDKLTVNREADPILSILRTQNKEVTEVAPAICTV